jgi:hypothetical protein
MSSLFKLPHRRSRKLVAAAVAALGILSFAACGSNSSANTGFEAASGSGAISGRPTPVDNPENKKVKIAVVAFAPAVAEFFKAYEADVLDSPRIAERFRKVQAPALLLRAPLGLTGVGDEVIPDETLKQINQSVPHLEDADIPGTNHNTIVQSVSEAKAVAEAIRTAGFGQEHP